MSELHDKLPTPLLATRMVDGVELLTDEGLFDACGVRIGFTARRGGVSRDPFASLNTASHVGDEIDDVEENRRHVLRALGAEDCPLIVPNQVHGTHVVSIRSAEEVDDVREEAERGADAVGVFGRGIATLLNFADCLPLIVVAPSGDFVVAHAGWRGAVSHIAARAIAALETEAGASPAECNAYIGPHIRSECFEVGPGVADAFAREFGLGVFADERHVSLARAVSADLANAGVDSGRIADADICTACNAERFYSYRASKGTCGRHAAAAVALREW